MQKAIFDTCKDPLGAMMLDYLHGRHNAYVEVSSTTLEMSTMPGKVLFRKHREMSVLEQQALVLCEGRILDVGAGSGCHSLYLQEQDREVHALDISPGCIEVMRQRKVITPIHQSLFSFEGGKYRTILMLMNGLGICGSLDGVNLFLQYVRNLLDEGGQVIADSTDLHLLHEATGADQTVGRGGYYGETEFVLQYQNITSDPFAWIYIDFKILKTLVAFNGLQCEQVMTGDNGQYLVRIF